MNNIATLREREHLRGTASPGRVGGLLYFAPGEAMHVETNNLVVDGELYRTSTRYGRRRGKPSRPLPPEEQYTTLKRS